MKTLFIGKPSCRAVECLVVSTAECERSFSAMNDIASDTRSSLGIKRISALMFAKLLGPKDVIACNPESYVCKLASGRHSADDTASRKRDPTKHSSQVTIQPPMQDYE